MTLVNRVRRGYYADSVALMRVARELEAAPGVLAASLMIGTPANKALLEAARLLATDARDAGAEDLVIAIRARTAAQAAAALELAEVHLSRSSARSSAVHQADAQGFATAASVSSALEALPAANLALISVPGEYAAREAERALGHGLNAMVFSDNVPLEEEVRLKDLALERGLLLMGPDCGTALIAGTPIAFANAVPRGDTGLVSASGTGLQEVSTLLARAGRGVSHGLGVGGRDLSEAVGARMTLAAFDLLEADAATTRIVVISKPPAPSVRQAVLGRAARSRKPVVLCLLGAPVVKLPRNVRLARTLEEAAGVRLDEAPAPRRTRGAIRGLFCGGTLCAEAQIVLLDHGLEVQSNAPVPGAVRSGAPHRLLDLGADEFTRGRPHPMIDPALRSAQLSSALRDRRVGVVLLDVVLGYGAHPDPAALIAEALRGRPKSPRALVVASVTGTEADPQVYSQQVQTLRAAGVVVARSNAEAARIAARAATRRGKPSRARRPRRSRPRSRAR